MKRYDVFISHANEDKDEIVRPLVKKLKELSIKVWYDEECISIGDSIIDAITEGLERSLIGIVILSKDFFKKNWTFMELGGISIKKSVKEQKLIPIIYNIDLSEIAIKLPFLADIKAIQCKDSSMIDHVALKICLIINELRNKYFNTHDLELSDIAKLFFNKHSPHSGIIAKQINSFNSLEKIDSDMAIIRAKILLKTILEHVLNRNNLNSDLESVVNNASILTSNIKEHFKLVFRFADISQNNTEVGKVMSSNNIALTTLTLKSILNWYYNTYQHNNVLSKDIKIVPIQIGDITIEDIRESFKIEQELLREDLISSIDDVIQWYEYNNYTMHGVRDENSGRIVGFINALPLTDECYEMIKSGNFPDINIRTTHIRKFEYPDFYKLYISSICIAPSYQNTEAFKILYNSLINIILELAIKNEVYFSELLSDACTDQGVRLSHVIGMKFLRESQYNTKLYCGTLIPPSLRLRNNMGKALINFYNNKFDEFKEILNL